MSERRRPSARPAADEGTLASTSRRWLWMTACVARVQTRTAASSPSPRSAANVLATSTSVSANVPR